MAKYLAGEKVIVYGTGGQTRTFCYVTDAITGFMQVLLKGQPGEPYNIGNPEGETDILGLVKAMSEVCDQEVKYEVQPHPESYPADEPQRRCPDIGKAQEIGYAPVVNLPDGLTRYLGWAKKAY